MENIDYDSLKLTLKGIVLKVFYDEIEKHGLKNIYGFALCSDLSKMSIAVNTYKHFEDSIKNNSGNYLDYKYDVEKWYERVNNNDIENYNKTLHSYCYNRRQPVEQAIQHLEKLNKLSIEVLNELKNEKVFNELNNDFILLITSNYGTTPEIFIRYNNKNNTDEYEKWMFDINDMSKS